MGIEFLGRVRKVTLALTLLGTLGTAVYLGLSFAAGILFASIWSLANLLWLEAMGRIGFAALKGQDYEFSDLVKASVGFPLLLVGGWAILAFKLPILAVGIGFWLLFTVVVLKALGIILSSALDFASGRSREKPSTSVRRPLPSRRSMGVVGWAIVAVVASVSVILAVASPDSDAPEQLTMVEEQGAAEHSEESGHGEETAHGDEAVAGAHGDEAVAGTHGEEGGHEGTVPHLPTFTGIIGNAVNHAETKAFITTWEDVFFSLLATFILVILVRMAFARPKLIPGRGQALVEGVASVMRDFVVTTFGEKMRRFVPFLGTVFLYILVMNWMGLVPLMKSSTANINTTLAMAIVVFFYAQYTAIRAQGFFGYLHHLAGSPRDIMGWLVAILLFPIEVMGEFIKPLSLGARLFGNVFGEDLLIAVFVGIGAALMAWQPVPVGFPIHVIFVFLALIMSAVQALVFALLAAVYLYMAQPIHEDEHEGAEDHGAAPAHA